MPTTPKRSTERHGHRTAAENATDTSAQGSPVIEWPPADPQWHPIARDWFDSLPESGQVVFFEPSDLAAARYLAEAMDQNLRSGKFSAVLFANVWSAMGDLLTTEASRRRLRVELEKPAPEDEEQAAAVASLADARARFGSRQAQ